MDTSGTLGIATSGLPVGWRWARLGEICEITARQVDPKVPEFGALPHVNGENIEGGTCRLLYLRTAAEEGMTSGKYLFEPGDVLYSKLRPYLRKAVVVDFRGVCSADMYPIRVNRAVLDPHFAAWMLVTEEFTRYADGESRRARMPKLNREQLFAWQAPLPQGQRIPSSPGYRPLRTCSKKAVLRAAL
jgi:type I restriction enzyme S subunit